MKLSREIWNNKKLNVKKLTDSDRLSGLRVEIFIEEKYLSLPLLLTAMFHRNMWSVWTNSVWTNVQWNRIAFYTRWNRKKTTFFFPFDLTQTEYNKTSLHALFNLSFSSIVGYDERQTEWITSAQYESFRVFYLTAFYTVHRARDKTAIRRRFSHKLSIADVFVERVMPKWTWNSRKSVKKNLAYHPEIYTIIALW